MSVREAFDMLPDHSEISYEMTFDAGHRIVGHKGKCARLHGHTYRVHIMAAGVVKPPGFVVDFGDLKELVNEWDHRMLIWNADPLVVPNTKEFWVDEGVVILPFNPTAENMARYLAYTCMEMFELHSVMVELWETPKCMARYVIS
jgi:6-pyruvoyltetrahydropterin/6-carboxytetrahydropterin synthase